MCHDISDKKVIFKTSWQSDASIPYTTEHKRINTYTCDWTAAKNAQESVLELQV